MNESGIILFFFFLKQILFLHYCQPLCTGTKYPPYVMRTCNVPGTALGAGICTMYINKQNRQKLLPHGTYIFLGEICLLLFMRSSIFQSDYRPLEFPFLNCLLIILVHFSIGVFSFVISL